MNPVHGERGLGTSLCSMPCSMPCSTGTTGISRQEAMTSSLAVLGRPGLRGQERQEVWLLLCMAGKHCREQALCLTTHALGGRSELFLSFVPRPACESHLNPTGLQGPRRASRASMGPGMACMQHGGTRSTTWCTRSQPRARRAQGGDGWVVSNPTGPGSS